ncbi:MAG: BamA/TamA family outer membrane protein, partial [Bacteriovoracaceae bacterium]|nr:BamA/TamA family outer membrane protein [Bacteriovoracaceae bacterium]
IRRELEIQEGEIFSGTKLRLSKEQVERLGFFEPGSVIFNQIPAPGKDDVLDIEITVKERNTGQISIGAGYSTATGFFTQASIAQNNFMGKGQNLSFTYFWGKTKTNFTLSFTEPYLFDTKWLAGADIFFTDNSASESYVYRTKGFALRVGYPIARYTKLFLTYRYDRTELKDDYDPTIDPKLENGVASLIRPSINYDRRNNAFEPTKGHYFNLSYEFAGLGGDRRWMKTEFDGRWYHDLGRDYTLRARLYAAKVARVGSRKVPRTEKLTLGGSRDMRGYAYEQIGPKVKATNTKTNQEQEFNQGGLFSLVSTLEVEHPLVREAGLKWVAFFDAGNVFERYYGEYGRTSLLRDYGVGIRWFSPLGIIRLGYGVPWGGPYRDEGGQFFFDIGEYF